MNINYKTLIKTILKMYFKKWGHIIISIFLPLIIGIIFLLIFGYKYNSFAFWSLPIITTCFLSLPIFVNNIKNNQIMIQQYKARLNSWKLTFFIPIIIFIYLMVLSILFILIQVIIFSFSYITEYKSINIKNLFGNINFINWVEMLFYLGYGAILGIGASFFINSITNNKIILIIISALITLYLVAFSGIIPYNIIYNNPAANIFSYFSIYRYISFNGMVAQIGFYTFNFKYDVIINSNFVIKHIDILINFSIPFILISLFISISSFKFQWFKKDKNNELIPVHSYKKKSFILLFLFISISFIFILTSIGLLIYANLTNVWNYKYILGSLFIIFGIISLCILLALLVRNIYVNSLIRKASYAISDKL